MDIRWIAKLKGEKEFLAAWENEKYDEKMRGEILFNAVSNNNAEERYKIVKLLLDKGYEVIWKNEEDETVLLIITNTAKFGANLSIVQSFYSKRSRCKCS